jgi:hypothetical protein
VWASLRKHKVTERGPQILTGRDPALKLSLDAGALQAIDLTHRGQLTIIQTRTIDLSNES